MSLRENVAEAIWAEEEKSIDSDHPPRWDLLRERYPGTYDRYVELLAPAAIAVVLAEIDAELVRRIGDADERERIARARYSEAISIKDRRHALIILSQQEGRVMALAAMRNYIRALGEGGEYDER
jgi:hypothetical protein